MAKLHIRPDVVKGHINPEIQGHFSEHLGRSRSRETGGSGLGLAITKHCVQENGGRISVWSRTGEGSTFTIELPAAPDEDDDEARSDESTQA